MSEIIRSCRECKYEPAWSGYQDKSGRKSDEGYCQWGTINKLPEPFKKSKIKRLSRWQSIECECWEHKDAGTNDEGRE